MTAVLVVGAGPVGTLLSSELTRHGVEVTTIDKRVEAGSGTRAIGIHGPVLAALEPSGITERMLGVALRVSRGEARSNGHVVGTVRFDRLSSRFPFVATLPQSATEEALAHDAPTPRRGVDVTAVETRERGIRLTTSDGDMQAPLVVLAGGWTARALAFRPGAVTVKTYRDRYLMTDAPMPGGSEDFAIVHLDGSGVLESFPMPGARRFVAWDDAPDDAGSRVQRLREAVHARGEQADAVTSATSFGVRRVVAPRLRRSRLFVIGDSAHEVSPMGGQGMNLGLLDAATLAPLLAQWVRSGAAPEAELRRWERRRVASARIAAAIATANTGLGRPRGPITDAVRRAGLGLALRSPTGRVFARTYAMGFDRDA